MVIIEHKCPYVPISFNESIHMYSNPTLGATLKRQNKVPTSEKAAI